MSNGSVVLWGALLSDGVEHPPSRIEIRGGRIAAIQASARPLHTDIAVEDGWIAPGLIDLQVNGAGGADLTSAADPEAALQHVARTLAQHGVTAFCPTVVSAPEEIIRERLRAYARRQIPGGAASLGPHIEGPFINPSQRGVHDPRMLRTASSGEIERWLAAGTPTLATLAPEVDGGLAAVRQLRAAGAVVSLGHSGADAVQTQAALHAGASMGTHLFNAMRSFHHREPGIVGALLASSAYLGLIVDGTHLDRLAVDLVVRRVGTGRVVLVSDALAAAGAPPGETALGDQAVVSDGRSVRRADGTIAGSALLLDGCVRTVREWLPWLLPAETVRMATLTPAQALGQRNKGRIAEGCDADLVVLDRDFKVQRTLVGGEVVEREPQRTEVRL